MPVILDSVAEWLSFIAAVAVALGIFRGLVSWLSTTVGRPWRLARTIERLAPGMRIESFRDVLGPPRFGNDNRQTWDFPECFVHVAVEEGQVQALAVTLRRPWFRVALPMRAGGTRLGSATFHDLVPSTPSFQGVKGANRWGYSEVIAHGATVTNLVRIAVSLNDAGLCLEDDAWKLAEAADSNKPDEIAALRRRVRFNTFAISAPGVRLECISAGPSYGVSVYVARLSPTARPVWMTYPVIRRTKWGRVWAIGK